MASERVPRIVVGSSKEGLPVAEAFKAHLEPEVSVNLWTDSLFTAGEYTLESLESRSRVFDGALVIGTSDDRVISRGVEVESIRDNLLFEFGMFVAIFGRRRAILALEGLGTTKLPSDLFGLTCVGFERKDPIADAVAAPSAEVKRAVLGFPLDVVEPEVAANIGAVLQTFLADLQAALGSVAPLGLHAWVVDDRVEPPRLVRVARTRTHPKAQLGKEFASGEGLVGECWRTSAPVFIDFSEEPYRSIQEKEWDEFGPLARKGMSFELLAQSRERYRAVGATPIISSVASGNRFLGCLSYNVGPNLDAYALAPRSIELESVLDKAVELVRILLESRS